VRCRNNVRRKGGEGGEGRQGSPGSDDPGLEGGRWKGCSGGPVYAPRGREGRGPSYRPKGKEEQWKKKRRGRRGGNTERDLVQETSVVGQAPNSGLIRQ
jgi:hypothetical protein